MRAMAGKKEGHYFAIEELVKTVSGNALSKSLEAKKQRYANYVDQAIEKHKKELLERKIEPEALRKELLQLADASLEKLRLVDDFFKFKLRKEGAPEKLESPTSEQKAEDKAKEQLNAIDSFFKG